MSIKRLINRRKMYEAEPAQEDFIGTPKNWTSEVVVRVWPNTYRKGSHTSFFKIPGKAVGHASVTFRRRTGTGNVEGVYVSWWPDKFITAGLSALKPQKGSVGGSYFLDKVMETGTEANKALRGGSPSKWTEQVVNAQTNVKNLQRLAVHRGGAQQTDKGLNLYMSSAALKDYLPGLMLEEEAPDNTVYWGLCGNRVAEWWDEFVNLDIYVGASMHYGCAGAAVTALRVAGMAAYVSTPNLSSAKFYMSPMNVMQLAGRIRDKLTRLNVDAAWLAADEPAEYARVQMDFKTTHQTDLWSPSKFKDESKLDWRYHRSSLVRKIDAALMNYHNAGRWEDNFQKKLKAMRQLFERVVEHRRAKPNSKRKAAMVELGYQILGKIRSYDVVNCDLPNPEKFL